MFISDTVEFREDEFPYSTFFQQNTPPTSSNTPTTAYISSHLLNTPQNSQHNQTADSFSHNSTTDKNTPTFPSTYSPLHTSDYSSNSRPTHTNSPLSVTSTAPVNAHPMVTRSKSGISKPKVYSSNVSDPIPEPDCVSQALVIPEWKAAMEDEYNALLRNNTWVLVPQTPDMNLITTKWLFRVKYTKDGRVDRYKARLVAKGFQQTAGVDYFNTYSPVIKPQTLRLLFTLAVSRGWVIQQVDINNAFLNGELKETVYIQQPEGFRSPSSPNHVCKLIKALYGLKQAPKAWYDTLKAFLVTQGFKHSTADHCLFHRQNKGHTTLVLIYVDDILITGDVPSEVEKLITDLNWRFSLKHLGVVNYFLGIEALVKSSSITLTQTKYAKDLN